jgi:hypothetical protein
MLGRQTLDRDLEVQLSHAGQQRLAGIGIAFDAQRRIGRDHASESDSEPLAVDRRFGFDSDAHDGLGRHDRLEHDRLARRRQRLAAGDRQPDHRADLARFQARHLLTLVGEQLYHTADAQQTPGSRRQHRHPLLEDPAVDADERHLPVIVEHDLESERGQRRSR